MTTNTKAKTKGKSKGPRRTPGVGEKETRVELIFGATSDPIILQLMNRGLSVPPKIADYQRYHDAIVLLKIHQLITATEGDKAYGRLARLIIRAMDRADKGR